MKKIRYKVKMFFKNICVIDKCLLLFMFILLMETTINILFGTSTNDAANSIDVVVRTSIASIFGYFISANFMKDEKSKEEIVINAEKNIEISNVSPIQFDEISQMNNTEGINSKLIQKQEESCSTIFQDVELQIDDKKYRKTVIQPIKIQVIIVVIIGLVALIIMLIVKNTRIVETTHIASLSQLRDLFSGAVGFLLGSPSLKSDK